MTDHATIDSLLPLFRSHSPELREGTITPTAGDKLTDLGIDSLELLSLASDIERHFDISVDDAALSSATTVADLLGVIDAELRRPE